MGAKLVSEFVSTVRKELLGVLGIGPAPYGACPVCVACASLVCLVRCGHRHIRPKRYILIEKTVSHLPPCRGSGNLTGR